MQWRGRKFQRQALSIPKNVFDVASALIDTEGSTVWKSMDVDLSEKLF